MTSTRQMTAEQIERRAEHAMDALDTRLMAGHIDQAEYDEAVRQLDQDVTRQHVAWRRPI